MPKEEEKTVKELIGTVKPIPRGIHRDDRVNSLGGMQVRIFPDTINPIPFGGKVYYQVGVLPISEELSKSFGNKPVVILAAQIESDELQKHIEQLPKSKKS